MPINPNLKILIVEDEVPMWELIVRLLQPLKIEFPSAEIIIIGSLTRALEIINSIPAPDITLLDLLLNDSNPDNTIKKIREIHSKSPVVVITNQATKENILKIQKLGLGIKIIEKLDLVKGNNLMKIILNTISAWRNDWWYRIQKEREISNLNLSRLRKLIYTEENIT